MVRYVVPLCVVFAVVTLGAQNKEQGRLENCGVVMEEILNVPDNIPHELLEKAECVIVIPSMMKAAVGIGGSYGRGAMVCRSGKSFDGAWGAPAMYAIGSGSVGFQLGAEATDLVLLVMNTRGVDALLSSQVKLGGNASVAAGPKGRTVEASTDASMRAEILSYSRSRGLVAGVATLQPAAAPSWCATSPLLRSHVLLLFLRSNALLHLYSGLQPLPMPAMQTCPSPLQMSLLPLAATPTA